MVFAIVGSGFGLYGYLPAVLGGRPDDVVTLPLAYKKVTDARPELRGLAGSVVWRGDIEDALRAASGVVVALPPTEQFTLASSLLAHDNVKAIVLEKPLAPTPAKATTLLDALVRSGKVFVINYTFVRCLWTRTVESLIDSSAQTSLELTWRFRAHHFTHSNKTWKRRHAEGGGVLRFYGIQVIAWLAHLGYTEVRSSIVLGVDASEPRCWKATFARSEDETLTVLLDCDSEQSEFSIASCGDSDKIVDLVDPFAIEPAVEAQDKRVSGLVALLGSLDDIAEESRQLYCDTNVLWSRVEARTEFASQI